MSMRLIPVTRSFDGHPIASNESPGSQDCLSQPQAGFDVFRHPRYEIRALSFGESRKGDELICQVSVHRGSARQVLDQV